MVNSRFHRAFCALCACIFLAGAASAREVIVRPGESLSLIAERELGSLDRWSEIAQLNGIDDPRRLQAGQRLLLPDGSGTMPSIVSAPATTSAGAVSYHIAGQPSIRRTTGAVRLRANANAPWTDLMGAVRLEIGSTVMTANTGRADFLIDDMSGDLGPFTVLSVLDLNAEPRRLHMRLDLGDLAIRSGRGVDWIDARAARVLVENGEARVSSDQVGVLKVTALSGSVSLVGPDGSRVPVAPGMQATVRPGAQAALAAVASPVRLVRPEADRLLQDPNVQFEWQPVPGASGYQLILTPDSAGQPDVRQDVASTTLEVRGVPEGGYTWRVIARGTADALPSPTGHFTVDRRPPSLRLNPPVQENGSWKLRGRTTPGARVVAGGARLVADANGDFTVELGDVSGLSVIGVEARQRDGGAAVRGAVAIAGRFQNRAVPVAALVPVGRVLINDDPAPDAITLSDGRTHLAWAWEVDGVRQAGGGLDVNVDMTAPEILSIRSTPELVKGGASVEIFVRAKDRGVGLAAATTASMTVEGPGGAILNLQAQTLTPENEYVFRFSAPADLERGFYRVSKLEVSDLDGNAIILETRGSVMETEASGSAANKPAALTHREIIKDIFLIAIGALVGSL